MSDVGVFVRGQGGGTPQRRRWLGPTLATLVLVAVVVLTAQPPDTGTPFDPESTGPTGLRALVDSLRELGASVTVTDDTSAATTADTVLVPPLGWDRDSIESIARQGPRVVAEIAPSLESVQNPLGVGGIGLVDLEPECDLLAGVERLRTSQWVGWQPDAGDEVAERCIVREAAAWLHRVPIGAGELVSLSTTAPLTNERFLDSDAALAGVRLLAPTGRETVVVLSAPPGEPPPTLFDLLDPRWFDAAWLTLAVLLVLALARGRRLGRPVDEDLPVRVPSGELARAIGDLRQRAGHHQRSAEVLGERTLDVCRKRLGMPASAPPDAVVAELERHGVQVDATAAAALTGTAPATDADGLVAVTRSFAALRARLHATSPTISSDTTSTPETRRPDA